MHTLWYIFQIFYKGVHKQARLEKAVGKSWRQPSVLCAAAALWLCSGGRPQDRAWKRARMVC